MTSEGHIIYKEDGKKDEFEYDAIVESLKYGNINTYSKIFKRNIPLRSILDKSVKPEDEKWRALRDCILRACGALQGNKKMSMPRRTSGIYTFGTL